MKRERDPILDRVRQQVPAPPDAFERIQRRRDAKAMRSRVIAGGLGIAVTIALVAALLGGGALRHPARIPLASGPSSVPLVAGDGQYYYTRMAIYGPLANGSVGKQGETEVWVGPDSSGRIRSTGELSQPQDQRYGQGQFPGGLLALSTDPAELLQQLIERGASNGASPNPIATTSPGRSQETSSLLRTAGDLLTLGGGILPPEQTRALYEALQGLPDITTTVGVLDPVGRPAVRLSFAIDYPDFSSSTESWYFTPDLGQFLGGAGMIVEAAGIGSSMDAPAPAEARYVSPGSGAPDFGPGFRPAGGTVVADPGPSPTP